MFMFRLPILTDAAGALGSTYRPPYVTVDGAYHARPSGVTSSTGSSRLVAWFGFLNLLASTSLDCYCFPSACPSGEGNINCPR